ncbi:unnamed protein product [Protopolystoma xenopodis]|uniref:Uncharacterized protein n=1 Tax=Protopolystoma xenopodis TaxID=117903 RepID=A0A3S5CGT8_9PLAT|nr:unnamed protein product [Protopolystoma xenopodis]
MITIRTADELEDGHLTADDEEDEGEDVDDIDLIADDLGFGPSGNLVLGAGPMAEAAPISRRKQNLASLARRPQVASVHHQFPATSISVTACSAVGGDCKENSCSSSHLGFDKKGLLVETGKAVGSQIHYFGDNTGVPHQRKSWNSKSSNTVSRPLISSQGPTELFDQTCRKQPQQHISCGFRGGKKDSAEDTDSASDESFEITVDIPYCWPENLINEHNYFHIPAVGSVIKYRISTKSSHPINKHQKGHSKAPEDESQAGDFKPQSQHTSTSVMAGTLKRAFSSGANSSEFAGSSIQDTSAPAKKTKISSSSCLPASSDSPSTKIPVDSSVPV